MEQWRMFGDHGGHAEFCIYYEVYRKAVYDTMKDIYPQQMMRMFWYSRRFVWKDMAACVDCRGARCGLAVGGALRCKLS